MGSCTSSPGGRVGAVAKHRLAITARSEEGKQVRVPVISKHEESKQRIRCAMEGNLLFEKLDEKSREAVVDSATKLKVSSGEIIIAQGDLQADTFYVVESGECRAYKRYNDGKERLLPVVYLPGTGFGELALLYDAPRAATIKATRPTRLWAIRRDVLVAIKKRSIDLEKKEKERAVNDSESFIVLSKVQKSRLADAFSKASFKPGEVIESQGKYGSKLYLVLQGSLAVTKNGKNICKKGPGGLLGVDILSGGDAQLQLESSSEGATCLVVSSEQFLELVGPIEYVWQYEILKNLPLLSTLQASQLARLAKELRCLDYQSGQCIFEEEERGTSLFIVKHGTVSMSSKGRVHTYMGERCCFGEHGLLNEQKRQCTATAVEPSTLLELTRENLSKVVGSLAKIKQERRINILCNVPLFSSLSFKQLSAFAKEMETIIFKDGSLIVERGQVADAFYILESGEAAVVNGEQEIQRLHPGDYFGELALMNHEVRRATVKAVGDLVVHKGSQELFDRYQAPLRSKLQANAKNYVAFKPERPLVTLKDLQQVACLGAGSFGKVVLVKYKGQSYALKIMSKHRIVTMNLQRHLRREKQVLEDCMSPFVVNLVSSFQDENFIYFMMDLARGGDFFTYLRSKGKNMTEQAARFYVGCVVLAIEYLHARNVAFRDLKPENLLLEQNGYVKLADFGFAKNVSGGKSYTMCGTPEYLAPEVILQSGHNEAVDWWAVGILTYEILCGRTPFVDDHSKMFRKICSASFRFPKEISANAKDFIRKLLSTTPSARLGMLRGGAQDIKNHPWFSGFDWHALQRRQMVAPYKPSIRESDGYTSIGTLPFHTPVPGDDDRTPRTRTLVEEAFQDF